MNWISVEKELPEKNGTYLCFLKTCLVTSVYFRNGTWLEPWGLRLPENSLPRFWQPMPEPPND